MRITAVDLWHVRSPLLRPYPLSRRYGTLTHAEAVVLRLTASDGRQGWGEADPLMPFTEESPAGALHLLASVLAPLLIDRNVQDRAAILADLEALCPGNATARGAIDIALHDLAGRAAGLPVHALLGGRLHEALPVLWPLGSGTADENAAVVTEQLARGFRWFMIKTGARDVAADAARTLELIARFHDRGVGFVADANQGWSEAEARRFLAALGTAPLALLEQPVPRGRTDALARLRAGAMLPVSADESVMSLADAAALGAAQAADAFSIKVSKNGGLATAQRIAALAQGHGIGILMNSMIEFGITQAASLQLGLSLPNLLPVGHAYMSTLRLHGDPTDFGSLVRDGMAHAPEAPGLGISVDETQLAAVARSHRRIEARRAPRTPEVMA